MAGQGMRMALKGSTPSAHARLKYITRQGRYAKGIDGDRDDLVASGSGNLPSWASDADQFWQSVDQFERANARLCVELELNLPPELNIDQQRQIVEVYVERLLGTERMPHTWAIHNGSRGKNPHVHLMFQERGLDGINRPSGQAWFKRANSAHPEKGGAKKSRSITGAEWTMFARATWAETVNDGLRSAGYEPRFDHRTKAAQRDEALRAGDLRRAATLGTLTERHEGATVYGMRRSVEHGDTELDDLPDFARQLIQQNDVARAYNNALRDWARTATETELYERLASELAELREQLAQESPSAHVAQWQHHQEQRRQQEAAEREQAHTVALVEWVERARARVIELRSAATRPVAVDQLLELKRAAQRAEQAAAAAEYAQREWRKKHSLQAAMADAIGIPLKGDKTARELRKEATRAAAKFQGSSDRLPVAAWHRAVGELKIIQEQLQKMEKAAGLESMFEQEARSRALLDEARRDLRRATGLINNHLMRCPYEERRALHTLRREVEQNLQVVKRLCQSPEASTDAASLRHHAAAQLKRIECWRATQDEAKVAAETQRLQEQPDQAQPDGESTIHNRGPRMR